MGCYPEPVGAVPPGGGRFAPADLPNYFPTSAAHNLGWHEVPALFRELSSVEAETNGTLGVTRNGQTLVLHPPHTKEVADTTALMTLRHFLERSEADARWLLVIDRREARIFDVETPVAVTLQISPHAPAEHFNAAPHAKNFSRGPERPTCNDGALTISQLFRFNAEGPIDFMRAEARGRVADHPVVAPWERRFWNYTAREGLKVPTEGEVSRVPPAGPKSYRRGRITRLNYEFAL